MKEFKTTLTCESGTFTDENGNDIAYTSYYIDVLGVKVKIKPCDKTAKQLLTIALESDVK